MDLKYYKKYCLSTSSPVFNQFKVRYRPVSSGSTAATQLDLIANPIFEISDGNMYTKFSAYNSIKPLKPDIYYSKE